MNDWKLITDTLVYSGAVFIIIGLIILAMRLIMEGG